MPEITQSCHTWGGHAGSSCNGFGGKRAPDPHTLLAQARRLRRLSEDGPINSFLWAAVAFLTFAVVLFTALWIDASRGVHSDDWRGAVDGATLFALCAGIAAVLGVIGLVVKFW
jgi:hypothetical protein